MTEDVESETWHVKQQDEVAAVAKACRVPLATTTRVGGIRVSIAKKVDPGQGSDHRIYPEAGANAGPKARISFQMSGLFDVCN